MEIDGKGTLRILLRDGDYKMAFEYIFLTGKSMEMDIVVKLLDALRRYRLSFYHLDDHRYRTQYLTEREYPYPNCSYLRKAILECF